MLPRQRRRWTTPRRIGPSLHKPRHLLRVVMPLGARPLVVTLRGITIPTTFFMLIIMGMFMQKYVGPYDGYIAYSIWIPKTLVANKRGPIEKWVPKSKQ